ncbi:MAG: helix-turn-helix domain-containing protein [Acidithiobacillus sp.]
MTQKAVDRLEVMQQLVSRTLRQQEAAQQLGLSVRQVKRLLIRFREKGAPYIGRNPSCRADTWDGALRCSTPIALWRFSTSWSGIYARLAPKVYRFGGIPDPDPCCPPPHSTGAAIDCKLVDGEGRDIPMRGPVDDFWSRS